MSEARVDALFMPEMIPDLYSTALFMPELVPEFYRPATSFAVGIYRGLLCPSAFQHTPQPAHPRETVTLT